MGASKSGTTVCEERLNIGSAALANAQGRLNLLYQNPGGYLTRCLFQGENTMTRLHVPSHRMTHLITSMMCVAALWFSTSCDAMNQNATTTQTFEHPKKSPAPRFIRHEVLVKFKDGISQERIASILKDNRIDVVAEIQRGRLYHGRISDDQSVETAITQLTSYQEIEYAEPNYQYEMQR